MKAGKKPADPLGRTENMMTLIAKTLKANTKTTKGMLQSINAKYE